MKEGMTMFAKPAERARGAFHHVPAGQLLVAAANSPSVRPLPPLVVVVIVVVATITKSSGGPQRRGGREFLQLYRHARKG